METKTEKKRVTLRLSVDLLNRLKEGAQNANKSLNSYVESILMEKVYGKDMTSE